MEAIGCCMICGDAITASFPVCGFCERTYGLSKSSRDWPTWAKRLEADHRAARRSERRRLDASELTFSDSPQAERLAYGEINDDPRNNGG